MCVYLNPEGVTLFVHLTYAIGFYFIMSPLRGFNNETNTVLFYNPITPSGLKLEPIDPSPYGFGLALF